MEAVIHNFPISDSKKMLELILNWLKDDGIFICTTTVDNNDYEGYEEKLIIRIRKKGLDIVLLKKPLKNFLEMQDLRL